MTRDQRYRYEMFVRVRGYGMQQRDLFPESSTGGRAFARVAATVAAIDEHMKNRLYSTAASEPVRAATRAAVVHAMKAFVQAGRRVTRSEPGRSPFRMPRRRSVAIELSAARTLIEEAEKRRDGFLELGLPPAYIDDFEARVDGLQRAVEIRVSGQALRRQTRIGLEAAFAQGLDIIRDLDVVMATASHQIPEPSFLAYQTARHIEGQSRRSRKAAKPAAGTPAEAPKRRRGRRRKRATVRGPEEVPGSAS